MSKYELKLTSAMVINANVVRAGAVVFLDETTAKDFLRRGKAELVAVPVAQAPTADADAVDVRRMNKAELIEHANANGVDVSDDLTKAQIIEAIEGSRE